MAKKKAVKKVAVKKTAAKKATAKKSTAAEEKKSTAAKKKAAVKKSTAKKSTAKKTASKKTVKKTVKKAVVKKTAKKASLKKAAANKKSTAKKTVKKAAVKRPVVKKAPRTTKEFKSKTSGYGDITSVESAKFEIGARKVYAEPDYGVIEPTVSIPEEYGDTKIVAMVRDIRWAYAYWEVSDGYRAKLNIPRGRHTRTVALRIYDVTNIAFNGQNAHLFFDIGVNDLATSWYFELPESGRSWCVDLGFFDDSGRFVTITRSNVFGTPSDTVSEAVSDTWMEVNEQQFAEIFRMSGGLEPRGGASGALLMRLNRELLEKHQQAVSSGAVSSGAVPVRPQSDFWFQVDAEVIIYGATEPTARVTLGGREIPLESDGTFTLRFALPDGEQAIALRAVKAGGGHEREATITVSRDTK